jgi:hypothetical protein
MIFFNKINDKEEWWCNMLKNLILYKELRNRFNTMSDPVLSPSAQPPFIILDICGNLTN